MLPLHPLEGTRRSLPPSPAFAAISAAEKRTPATVSPIVR